MKNKGKKAVFCESEIDKAREYVKELDSSSKEAGGLVVLLMSVCKFTGDQVASLLQMSGSTVDRIVSKFRRGQLSVAKNPGGGRNHCHMSPEEEAGFLEKFREMAESGCLVTVDSFASGLEGQLKTEVKKDYIYKMLKRNGWRKVAPDKAHPKNDPEKMDEFKKKLSRARHCWVPPSQA